MNIAYIKYVTFSVILAISLLMLFIVMRYSFVWTNSFDHPIQTITEFLNNIEVENLEDTSLSQFEPYFTCHEIRELIEALITLVNNLKYANQKILNQDPAIALVEISKAKKFYMDLRHFQRVGICSNNIANLHAQSKRFFEAVVEYQEAIMMAKIEYKEIKQKMANNLPLFWQITEEIR